MKTFGKENVPSRDHGKKVKKHESAGASGGKVETTGEKKN